MAADGTIKIYTDVDLDGIKNGTKQIERFASGVGNTIKNIAVGISGSANRVKNFNRSLSGTESQLKKIGGLVAGAFAVHKIIDFGRECLELGSDLQEVQNVVDSVFTTMSDKVDEFAQNAAMSAGLSETMAKKFAGTFGAMAKSFGFAESEALEMSTTLTQLSGDVASFYNITQDEAYTKLKSVFTGETESLKELGVVMTQAALDQYALANGFGKTTSAMTEQEKVALRYRFVMDQLSTASGDFLRTSDGWANQVRVLKLQIDSLKATIGQGMINMFTPAIKVINVLLAKFATVANAFKSFSELITGKKSSGNTGATQAGIGTDDVAASYEDAASGAENFAAATDDVTDATKNAQKAQLKYLSTLDEVKKFGEDSNVDAGSSGNGTGTAGALGGLSAAVGSVDYGTLAEGETILESSLNRLEELIRNKDWEGIGAYAADGLNRGMELIREAISWDNIGPDVEYFTEAFTGIFNSFVEELDWDLLGRTVGTGVNTIVYSVNGLIGKIQWKTLGMQLSNGIDGLVTEVDWRAAGNLFGNKFMIVWNVLYGAARNAPYRKIGNAIATYLNGALEGIDFDVMGDTLAFGINGAFDRLEEFTANFKWEKTARRVSSGINQMIHNIDWEDAGYTLDQFFKKILDSMLLVSEEVDWEGFGEGIGEFLSELDWGYYLSAMFKILKNILGGIWKGLGKTAAGRFIQAIIAFKLGTRLMPFVNSLVYFFTGQTVSQKLTDAFKKLFSKSMSDGAAGMSKGLKDATDTITKAGGAASTASGGFGSFASSVIGSAAALGGSIIATTLLTHEIAEMVDKAQGGNGVLTNMGAALKDLTGKLENSSQLTSSQKDEIDALIESLETEGATADEMAAAAIAKLSEYGISAAEFSGIINDAGFQMTKTSEDMEILTSQVGLLGAGFSETAGMIDLSSVSMEDAFKGIWSAMAEMSQVNSDVNASMMDLEYILDQYSSSAVPDAQAAFDALVLEMQELGLPVEDFISLVGEKFPEAVVTTNTTVSAQTDQMAQNITQSMTSAGTAAGTAASMIEKNVSESMQNADSAVETATDNMAQNASEAMSAVETDISGTFGNVETESESTWSGSESSVTEALKTMKSESSQSMRQVYLNVQSYLQSILNIMNNTWEWSADTVEKELQNMDSSVTTIYSGMSNRLLQATANVGTGMLTIWSNVRTQMIQCFQSMVSGSVSPLNNMVSFMNRLINGAQNTRNLIAELLSFDISLPEPISQITGWSRVSLNIPKAYTSYQVPYLATGAIIPPNAPFMAMLGDQRNGTNLEAPESLIRQIMREELANAQKNGGSYQFTAQINRRTLFDEFIEEAKLRQMATGRNPLELI